MGPAYSFEGGRAHCVRDKKSVVSTYPVKLNMVLLFFVIKSKIYDGTSIFHMQNVIITWRRAINMMSMMSAIFSVEGII